MYLKIFPNGKVDDVKGHVSVYLFNKISKQVYLHYMIQIGSHGKKEHEGCLNPGAGRGRIKFCNHVRKFPIYKPDEDLKITCKIVKITTDKVVWDLFHKTNNKFKESKANQVDLKAKLAMMETKLEELQNFNDNNNNSSSKVKKPPCPICFEEMSYNSKIAQCINGHHICWSCKEKLEKKECPSCGLPVNGRAFGMESYLRSMFDVHSIQPLPYSNNASTGPGPMNSLDNSEPISSAIVKYNYQAQQLDELSLVKGSRVMILEKSGDGWWRGQYGNKIGWFPSNYTQEEIDDPHTYCVAENVLDIMVALYPFKAQNDTELSFSKGDRLEILDRPSSDPEWFKARNQMGQLGLVPSNYLLELSQFLTQDVGVKNGTPGPAPETPHSNGTQRTASNGNNGTTNEDVRGKSWYFGPISRADCDVLMAEKGQDGDFLVRDSESTSGDFSVSLKAPGRNKHFRVHVENGMYCIGQRKFVSLQQLVDHYQRAPIYTSQKGEKLFLIKPLPK